MAMIKLNKDIVNKNIENLKILIDKGLFHIFGTNVINSGIAFITNILIVKFLTKSDYGVFSYANNALSIFSLMTGLGISSGLLQFCSEQRNKTEKAAFFRFGFKLGISFNIILGLGIWIYGNFAHIAIRESAQYIKLLMFLPVFELGYSLFTIILRTKKENKQYSLLLNFNSITYSALSCLGAVIAGIPGTIIGRYVSFSCSIIIGVYFCRSDIKSIIEAGVLEKIKKKEIVKYSTVCCASNSISQLLYLLDVYLIGVYIGDSSIVASYKTATLIPTALTFIPSGIMVFIYPYFAEHNKDWEWIVKQMKRLFKILAVINIIISLGLFLFAPIIIKILWGDSYMDSLVPLRILSVNYFFLSTIRIPCGNILAMLRKVKVNLYISIISGVANIILDIWLIQKLGSNGAAFATLGVVLISSVLLGLYLLISLRQLKVKVGGT